MDIVKIGILGVGNMGIDHAHNISLGKVPGMELTAVADIDPLKLERAKNELPSNVSLFESAEAMLESGLINALLVAVPHYDHPKYTIQALNRGIHVMSEKPAGVYTKQVREMNEAAAKANAVFGMMFNQRTDHIFRKMHEIVKSGALGELKRTNWIITNWYRSQTYYDSGTWRATWKGEGGGVLLNQCPHNLDLWQWICGMPSKVRAHLHYGKWHDIEVEDDVSAYVEYPNGATGLFVTTTGDAPGTNRFELTFDKGKLIAEDNKLKLWELGMSEPEFSLINTSPFACPPSSYSEPETDGLSEQHIGILKAFTGAILRNEPLIAAGEEGINGLLISNAMHLSSWLDKTIDIPFDEDLYFNELQKRIGN